MIYTLIDVNNNVHLVLSQEKYIFTKHSIYFGTVSAVHKLGVGELKTGSDFNISLPNDNLDISIKYINKDIATALINAIEKEAQ